MTASFGFVSTALLLAVAFCFYCLLTMDFSSYWCLGVAGLVTSSPCDTLCDCMHMWESSSSGQGIDVQAPAVMLVPNLAHLGHVGRMHALFRLGMMHSSTSSCEFGPLFIGLLLLSLLAEFPGRCRAVCFIST